METAVWLSDAVEKTWLFLVGIVVFRSMSLRGHAAQGLDAQGQRRHVEEQYVLHLAGEHRALDGRADRHHLVGVHAAVRLFLEELLHRGDHLGHARHAAHQDRFVDLFHGLARVGERLLARVDALLDQVVDELFELCPGKLVQSRCLGPLASAVMKGRLISVSMTVDSSHLGLFRRFLEPLERHLVLAQVDALSPS